MRSLKFVIICMSPLINKYLHFFYSSMLLSGHTWVSETSKRDSGESAKGSQKFGWPIQKLLTSASFCSHFSLIFLSALPKYHSTHVFCCVYFCIFIWLVAEIKIICLFNSEEMTDHFFNFKESL